MTATEVDVWEIPLEGEKEAVEYRRLLSEDELRRAERFRFDEPRARFIAARAAMRQILSGYLNIPAQQLVFAYGAQGKPELPPYQAGADIKFNLSHSRDRALLAVTRGLNVGVDIEYVDQRVAGEEIASHFFSPAEVDSLRNVADGERAEGFFCCWTRKEAYIKAVGKGLSVPLSSFDVSLGHGIRPALLRVESFVHEPARWSMYDVDVPNGYKAALVVEGRAHRLHQKRWNLND